MKGMSESMAAVKKPKTKYFCTECGYETPKWMGKCPGCNQWNTLTEELVEKKSKFVNTSIQGDAPKPITQVPAEDAFRVQTSYGEFNRLLGGGIVNGGLHLIGGDPGIGKSTLLLQIACDLAQNGHRVLYVSGEESMYQTKLRAQRLGLESDELYLYSENDLNRVTQQIEVVQPKFLIIDSIQTVYLNEVASAPGSVSQVRECTGELMRIAKSKQISTFVVGHVTKEGTIAGPKLLEHMVDAVLYFEGEQHNSFRILRSVKNRFGATNEIAIFDMQGGGLVEVLNPSVLFLEERTVMRSGVSIVAAMEGSRPILVEIQSLLSPTAFGNPRRMSNGIENNRTSLILAVLEKRAGLLLQNQDAYIKVVGGVKLDEPAADLALALCIVSSFRDRALNPTDVIIGEVGLTGEVRRVVKIEERLKEAKKLGFKRAIIPKRNVEGLELTGIEIIGVADIQEAIQLALQPAGEQHLPF
ncbi:MAG: DNA repair protein RadA [Culicoidibacterales bacterium]